MLVLKKRRRTRSKSVHRHQSWWKPITFHGLRHTHGSILLYKKASIHYISERLGHGDIETTLKTYTHVLTEMRHEEEQLIV